MFTEVKNCRHRYGDARITLRYCVGLYVTMGVPQEFILGTKTWGGQR